MKVIISLRALRSKSKTRGIGVYTRELIAALKKYCPAVSVTPTTHDHDGKLADLVHFPSFDPFFLTLPLKKLKPTVVTVHDLIPLKFPKHFPPGMRGALKWRLQKWSLKGVDHIITDSKTSKSDIVEILHYPKKKISVIPLAPSVEYAKVPATLSRAVQKTYELPARYILYVGDINWNKNVTGLVRAFGNLTDPSLHLVLVGAAFTAKPHIKELENILSSIEESGVKERVHRIGYVPTHHLPALYSHATLYVQPSWYEGFGFPVLEAMQYNCPVLASETSALKEIGVDAVGYFNPKVKGALEKGIKNLLSNKKKLEELRTKGRKRVKEYSWEKTARATYAVYKKVLELV